MKGAGLQKKNPPLLEAPGARLFNPFQHYNSRSVLLFMVPAVLGILYSSKPVGLHRAEISPEKRRFSRGFCRFFHKYFIVQK
jgi:hypothetical protein